MQKKVQKTMLFQPFVVWEQVKVAPSNKANKKSSRGLVGALGRSVPRRKSPKRPPSGAQGRPRRSLTECNKGTKSNGFSMIRDLAAIQGGTTQHNQQEEQQEGPKGPMTIFGPQTSGHLWPQEAPKWGPRASQEEPCGVQKGYKNQWFFNDSWFGSKSRWHQATRPARRATRGPQGAYATFWPS